MVPHEVPSCFSSCFPDTIFGWVTNRKDYIMFWFWTITTIACGLVAGLIGFQTGGHPAALAFTVCGTVSVLAIKNIIRTRSSVLGGCIIAFTLSAYFFGWSSAFVVTLLAFSIQLSIDDLVHKRSAILPIALTAAFASWAIAFSHFDPMTGLIAALLSFITVIGIEDYFLQTNHAILRNFPVIGWFRYGFELIGDELRQYWFMSDTEEWPYNRETRKFIYRAAKGKNHNLGFGSKRDYSKVGEIHMLPTLFPIPDSSEFNRLPPLIIGKNRKHPYACPWPVNISGMSWGSLSAEMVMALSSGALHSNIHMVTGEGGLTPYHTEGAVTRVPFKVKLAYKWKLFLHNRLGFAKPVEPKGKPVGGGRLVIQLGPAKFGFRQIISDLVSGAEARGFRKRWSNKLDLAALKKACESDQVVALEVKIGQGFKPGQGGKLPKEKITPELAKFRGIPMDENCYSPNNWDEFDDVPSMFAFVKMLQDEIEKPTGIKFPVGQMVFIEQIASQYKELGYGPDFLTIDGGEGGTGAGPAALGDHMGLPILHAIPIVDNMLREYGVRDEVVLIASGQIAKGSDVVIAIALGADMVNVGRANMMAGGCIMAMKCQNNTCPTGVATQDPRLRRGLDPIDKYPKVANYNLVVQRELLQLLKSIGVHNPWELRRCHLSVVDSPFEEVNMETKLPYPDGDDGSRNPTLGDIPEADSDLYDAFGPRLIDLVSLSRKA